MINRYSRSLRFLAPMLALGVAACSGAPGDASISAPAGPRFVRTTAAVGDAGNRIANQGELEICKSGAAGSFEVTPQGGSAFTVNLAAGECRVVATALNLAGPDTARFSVIELPSATSTFTSVTKTTVHFEYAGGSNTTPDEFDAPFVSTTNVAVPVKVNEYIGSLLEYVNTPIQTGPGCTYTKGWYRNHGSNTVIASADGLTKSQQQQVFNATPGKPGSVTWTGGNNTLNLYQQLLAAINNLGGDETAGPASVDAAIAAAKAGTNVTTNGGGVQIALVAGTNVSGLIDALSSFNEGKLAGIPHCGDEVIAQ